MKPFWRQSQLQDRHVRRQDRIQSSVQISQGMSPSHFKANDLPPSMNPPIGPASTNHSRLDPSNTLQCSLDLALNRPLVSLDLKAVKVRTIVLDFGPVPTRFSRF
jgi:hypothetical protein